MKPMRIVKVFIASSEELQPERERFDTLFNHLNNIFERRGIMLLPVKWEFLDASMGEEHKQEEYNRAIRECDLCVVMFWQKFGTFTDTELRVADAEQRAGRLPKKVYVFFKEPGDYSAEIETLKARFEEEYGHFYCKFNTSDQLQLDFTLQLERYLQSDLTTVENSQVKIDGVVVAELDRVGFAAGNSHYNELKQRLATIEAELTALEAAYAAMPNEAIEGLINDKKRARYELQEVLKEHEKALFDTAVRVAHLAGEKISERMQRAIALFEQGKVSEANLLLDEAERDADQILAGVQQLKEAGRQSVDELMLKASVVLADEHYPIDERISKAESLCDKALALANECGCSEEKQMELLEEITGFLIFYAKYEKALRLELQLLAIREKVFGVEHHDTSDSYNNIGIIYDDLGDYKKALEYYLKALAMRTKVLGEEHPDTAGSYNNIGNIYTNQGDYEQALEFLFKSLAIREKVLGEEHPDTAISYNNIGVIYAKQGDYEKALEYYFKALVIREKALGVEHPDMAASYNNIGLIYYYQCNYNEAVNYLLKGITIYEKILGKEHPETALSYNNLGICYQQQGNIVQALEYHKKALASRKITLGSKHPDTAQSYNNIGVIFCDQDDYQKALDYYYKALAIWEKVLGSEHPNTRICQENIEEAKAKLAEEETKKS